MLIIFSTSYDTTVDLLLHYLRSAPVFRYNTDRWEDYQIEIGPSGFRLQDPAGRLVNSSDITKALWRKPAKNRDLFPEIELPEETAYCETEVWYAMREMVNILWKERKIVLIEPLGDLRAGKFVQLDAASRYFSVPDYQFRLGFGSSFPEGARVITKSLTLEPVASASHSVLFATLVDDCELSPSCPWLVQEYVHADADITVVFVRGRIFAYELDRTPFLDRTVDWRELPVDDTSDNWQVHQLPDAVMTGITAFMEELGLHFGRLDFLCRKGTYYFLEVNPNGQWAWLDAERKNGLLSAIIEEILPGTPCNPIPVSR
ncbi:MAG: hypothetical protein HGB36_13005 [Chlorobiaceae bacterium]|nr:hypothetical protein [Chlorobiaceae bacterium]